MIATKIHIRLKNVIPMSRSSLLADTKRPLPNGTKQLEALASYNNIRCIPHCPNPDITARRRNRNFSES